MANVNPSPERESSVQFFEPDTSTTEVVHGGCTYCGADGTEEWGCVMCKGECA